MTGRRWPGRPALLVGVLALAVAAALLLERQRSHGPVEMPVLGIAAADVVAVHVEEGGQELRAVRVQDDWRVDLPSPARPGSDATIADLVDAVVATVALDSFRRPDLDRRVLGLEPPRARIELSLAGRSDPVVLLLGDFAPSGGSVYAAREGDPRVFRIGALIASEIENALHAVEPAGSG